MIINIGLCGSTGRVGRVVVEKAKNFNNCKISATFSRANNIDDLAEFCQRSTIIIDFSSAGILDKLLDYAEIYQNKLVIGTTGLSDQQFTRLNKLSQNLAILYSANMSLGANLLAVLTQQAAKILDHNYDIEICESHHRMKNDSPSGTAIMLGKIAAKARNLEFNQYAVLNRSLKGRRQVNEIGITAIRGGMVHGEHEVLFLGDEQVLSLKHQALSKESFADGAIRAAIWLADKSAGLYSMKDVLKL